MPRINGTSNRQTSFIRALRQNLGVIPPDMMPSPLVLRKWLRRPRFRAALRSVNDAIRLHADLEMQCLAATVTRELSAIVTHERHETAPEPVDHDKSCTVCNDQKSRSDADEHPGQLDRRIHSLSRLLRLTHLRQRFPGGPPALPDQPPAPPAPVRPEMIPEKCSDALKFMLRYMRDFPPEQPLRDIIEYTEALVVQKKPAKKLRAGD